MVRDLLFEYLASEDAGLRQVAVIALEHFELKSINLPESYWQTLVEGLASEDEAIVESMAARIEEHGVSPSVT
jgi:hypothetical protein